MQEKYANKGSSPNYTPGQQFLFSRLIIKYNLVYFTYLFSHISLFKIVRNDFPIPMYNKFDSSRGGDICNYKYIVAFIILQ